jgi:hypothetical protein
MKQLMLLMSMVLMIAFALPAIACDQCGVRDGPSIMFNSAELDDMVYQPVMANQESLLQPSPYDVIDNSASLVLLATLTDPTESIDQRARHVIGGGTKVAKDTSIMTAERGGFLLRQGGKPAVI